MSLQWPSWTLSSSKKLLNQIMIFYTVNILCDFVIISGIWRREGHWSNSQRQLWCRYLLKFHEYLYVSVGFVFIFRIVFIQAYILIFLLTWKWLYLHHLFRIIFMKYKIIGPKDKYADDHLIMHQNIVYSLSLSLSCWLVGLKLACKSIMKTVLQVSACLRLEWQLGCLMLPVGSPLESLVQELLLLMPRIPLCLSKSWFLRSLQVLSVFLDLLLVFYRWAIRL